MKKTVQDLMIDALKAAEVYDAEKAIGQIHRSLVQISLEMEDDMRAITKRLKEIEPSKSARPAR